MRHESDAAFVCFTDDSGLTSETWEMRVVNPELPRDLARSVRYPKILGTPLSDEFDETLWIDNRVILTAPPENILHEMLASADLGVLLHSFRLTVLAEFDAVVEAGLDEPARVYEQLLHYAETAPETLDARPFWGGFIARRWTPEVRLSMRIWMDQVLRYSRRDQLSFRFATAGLTRVATFEHDNRRSPWHEWPPLGAGLGRDIGARRDAFRVAIRAPLAEVAALRAELVEAKAAVDRADTRARAKELEADDLRERLVRLESTTASSVARADAEAAARRRAARTLSDLEQTRAVRVSRKLTSLMARIAPRSKRAGHPSVD